MNTTLYEITDAIKKIENMDGEGNELKDYLDGVNLSFEEKVNNIIRFRRTTELTIEAIKSEEKRLSELRKSYEKRNERLKQYLGYNLSKLGRESYESEAGKIGFRKSTAIIVEDINKLPEEFVKKTVKLTADKPKLKKYLTTGEKLQGVDIVERKNIIIK